MIISDLYETKIECSNYNVNIDDNTVTVTVTLKDFNQAVVTGKNVELKCDKGYFTKVVHNGGTTTLNNTKTTSARATNSNGQITATWTASDWGLCTFTANNNKIQLNVGGTRSTKITLYSGRFTNDSYVDLTRNNNMVICNVHVTGNTALSTSNFQVATLPSEYAPKTYTVQSWVNSSSYGIITVSSSEVRCTNILKSTTNNIMCNMVWFLNE